MIKKIKMPEENVEYTFRFPPKKLMRYRWFGDVTEQGRLLLWNVNGYYTGMTAVYFTHLLRNRLVERKPVAPVIEVPVKKEKDVVKPTTTVTHGQPPEPKFTVLTDEQNAENIRCCNRFIKELKGYSDFEKQFLKIKLEKRVSKDVIRLYDVENLINDVERLKGDVSDDEYSAVMSRYYTASEIVRSYRAQCGALKV